jgi:hypothetical protein
MKRAAVPSILVVVVLLAVGVIAEAQQPKKVPRIGYLASLPQQLVVQKNFLTCSADSVTTSGCKIKSCS